MGLRLQGEQALMITLESRQMYYTSYYVPLSVGTLRFCLRRSVGILRDESGSGSRCALDNPVLDCSENKDNPMSTIAALTIRLPAKTPESHPLYQHY